MKQSLKKLSTRNFKDYLIDKQIEMLIIALMVLLDQRGEEVILNNEKFQFIFDIRHNMGIQVHELEEESIRLKSDNETVNPYDVLSSDSKNFSAK